VTSRSPSSMEPVRSPSSTVTAERPSPLEDRDQAHNYAGGNPITRYDRTGKNWIVVVAVGAAIAVGAVMLFKDCMERCAGVKTSREPACPPPSVAEESPSKDKIAKCAYYGSPQLQMGSSS